MLGHQFRFTDYFPIHRPKQNNFDPTYLSLLQQLSGTTAQQAEIPWYPT